MYGLITLINLAIMAVENFEPQLPNILGVEVILFAEFFGFLLSFVCSASIQQGLIFKREYCKIKILIRDCIKESDTWNLWHLIKEIQVSKK